MSKPSDLYEWVYAGHPWDESLESALKGYGFDEPKKAWRNLTILAGHLNFRVLFPDFFPRFLDLLSQSYQSDIALHNFERFSEKFLDKNYLFTFLDGAQDLLRALLILFSGSQALTDTLLKHPEYFDWLKQPETLGQPKSKDVLYRDFYVMAGTEDLGSDTPLLLRRFKKREYVRIGLRDLLGLAGLEENVEDISNLADVCLQVAYEYADKTLKKKYGAPVYQNPEGEWLESEFAVVGMGKLGGRELNYSSDIDIIYIYTSSRGETRNNDSTAGTSVSNHEFFTRLGQMITTVIGEINIEGRVFRVDLDLRPEGKSGEIANSLASSEIYYQSWGRTWERQALIKARVCAGSESLGKAFFSMLEPFIYRRYLDYRAIDEIKAMKRRIDESLKTGKGGSENIKLGFGGIREIEFIVQAHQLLFGGRHKSLRVANTLTAMGRLQRRGFFSADDYARLREAYIFLRRLEHRVQMAFGLQTHSLPRQPGELAVLARKMGIRADGEEETVARLRETLRGHTRFVGDCFARLFAGEKTREITETASRQWERAEQGESRFSLELMKTVPFTDPDRAFRFLKTLRDGSAFYHPSEKSIRTFYSLLPGILEGCSRAARPNSAVENLVKFLEATRAKETFFNLLLDNEGFLNLLMALFGSGEVLPRILIRHPEFMDALLGMESIYRFKTPEKVAADLVGKLKSINGLEDKKTFLRRFKQAEELRVGVRYLIGETDLLGTLADLSTLAEIYLKTSLETARQETARQYGIPASALDDFAVVAMGKLGSRELNFGSDLDVVFIYDEPRTAAPALSAGEMIACHATLAQTIYRIVSEPTHAGYAYKIDSDLRPEGSQGILVQSVKGYERYFATRARIWERQAMTRARFVAGNSALAEKFLAIAHAFTYRPKLEYGSLIEIARLRERMEKELAGEAKKGKNVKLGFGGLADIEFSAQILQLMHGHRHPRLRETNTLSVLRILAETGILDDADATRLRENYLYLRRLECLLRIQDEPAPRHLPRREDDLAALAKLMDYRGKDNRELASRLMRDYERTTREVRAFYRKNLDTLLRTAL
ncbi:MAG: bifunctional [glutamate--ammonia ligase]-adenylyl-L-tyrosine phosphorylase/[glutamate--ammonia-ligase] adenylyltransferase [Nitrospinales bacterium]